MKKLFNSKYPIICAPMNGVSDLNLALACARAGIVPSLLFYSFSSRDNFSKSVNLILEECEEIQVSMTFNDILINSDLIKKLKITHIEILEYEDKDINEKNKVIINDLRSSGVKILFKILLPYVIEQFYDIIDAVTIKGSEGAGRSAKDVKLENVIADIKLNYPNLEIIASGGIKNSEDIKSLINHGACAVSIGTLFAMSAESSIPVEVKNKLLQSSINNITRLKSGARQRAIVFDEKSYDDFNNTHGLYTGLRTGTNGHIFVGNAIDTITEIRSVQEIVDYLVS